MNRTTRMLALFTLIAAFVVIIQVITSYVYSQIAETAALQRDAAKSIAATGVMTATNVPTETPAVTISSTPAISISPTSAVGKVVKSEAANPTDTNSSSTIISTPCATLNLSADQSGNTAIDSSIAALSEKYQICIEFNSRIVSSFAGFQFQMLGSGDYAQLQRYLAILDDEFNKYDPQFIRNMQLEGIELVKGIAINGQNRSAVPDYNKNILYYDVYLGSGDENYVRHVIHHEFYHMIEARIFGNAYYSDTAWNSLNNSGFKYGSGGSACYSGMPTLQSGFVTAYAMCALEEDKAETFAFLMDTAERTKLAGMMANDSTIASKATYIANELSRYSQNIAIPN